MSFFMPSNFEFYSKKPETRVPHSDSGSDGEEANGQATQVPEPEPATSDRRAKFFESIRVSFYI